MRNLQTVRGWGKLAFILLFSTSASAYGAAPISTQKLEQASTISPEENKDFESLLGKHVYSVLSKQSRAEMLNSVRFNVRTNEVIVDLSASYLPERVNYVTATLERSLHEISTDVIFFVERNFDLYISGVTFTFDGRDLSYYYPEDYPAEIPGSGLRRDVGITGTTGGQIVLSAGHGLYLKHSTPPAWEFQRPLSLGVQEDQITQTLVYELANLVHQRGLRTIQFVRSYSTSTHAPSGAPWIDVAARYNLAQALPGRKDIWNSLPGSTGQDREQDEDIRSRPLYANAIDAAGIISIHTNAFTTPIPRGTRVYYQPGRSADRELARSILCYMGEIIQAQDGYEEFPIAPDAHSGDLGENRLAIGRSAVIVEAAFHTNPDDAAALQDPVFRTAAMKGVEKGARLFELGEPCTPYNITDIPDISGPWGSTLTFEISYEGFPQYPVILEVILLSCTGICEPGGGIIPSEIPSPIQVGLACNGEQDDPPVEAEWRVSLIDEDGVKGSYDFTSVCGVSGGATTSTHSHGTPTISVMPLR